MLFFARVDRFLFPSRNKLRAAKSFRGKFGDLPKR